MARSTSIKDMFGRKQVRKEMLKRAREDVDRGIEPPNWAKQWGKTNPYISAEYPFGKQDETFQEAFDRIYAPQRENKYEDSIIESMLSPKNGDQNTFEEDLQMLRSIASKKATSAVHQQRINQPDVSVPSIGGSISDHNLPEPQYISYDDLYGQHQRMYDKRRHVRYQHELTIEEHIHQKLHSDEVIAEWLHEHNLAAEDMWTLVTTLLHDQIDREKSKTKRETTLEKINKELKALKG